MATHIITLDPEIIKAFKEAKIPLIYYPDRNEGKGTWRYIGSCGGPLIELWTGINRAGKPGVFGTYSTGFFSDQYSICSCMSDWIKSYGKYLPEMAQAKEIIW